MLVFELSGRLMVGRLLQEILRELAHQSLSFHNIDILTTLINNNLYYKMLLTKMTIIRRNSTPIH